MNDIVASKAIKFLEEHQSETPSRFAEEATWRKKNASWLRRSHRLAVTIIGYMQNNGLKRGDLGVSPQYLNLSFKSIAHIEDKLGRICVAII